MAWPRYVALARSPLPVCLPAREKEAAKNENPEHVKLTVRCSGRKQITIVTAK